VKSTIVHATSHQQVRRLIHATFALALLLLASPASLAADDLFGPATHYWTGVPRVSVAAHDVSGDGHPDVFVGLPYPYVGFGMLLGSADGTLTPAVGLLSGNDPRSFAFGFFNDDELIDLAVACTGSHYVEVRLNSGSAWYFDDSPDTYSTGDSPVSVAAGDLNGDGFDDLVVANRDSESVSVLLNDQDGTFTVTPYPIEEPDNPGPNVPVGVGLGDFDGDGATDIVVLLSASDRFWPMWNDGTGTFSFDEIPRWAGDDPVALTVADFDGDGFDDVAVTNTWEGNEVCVWTGYGNESNRGFHGPDWYGVSDSLTGIATGDFDGDGNLDLAVSDGNDNCVWVLLGDGAGVFGTADTYSVGEQPVAIEAVDLNSDGASDLVTANLAGEDVSVLLASEPAGPSTVDLTLTLEPGWNMVSVPVVPADTSRAAVFPPVDVVAVYTWDPGQKSYVVPDTIEPEVGYWVAVTEGTTIKVTGTPKTTWPSSLITGWNMVGSVYGTAVSVNDADAFDVDPSGSVLTNAIYWWNPESKSYVAETSIVKGQGYWMAATADCTLTMCAPEG